MSKILIVDDDPDIVFMIREMLITHGFEVMVAADGHHALSAIKTNVPDLMIVDLTMPVMDGWRLCMKVRKDERYKTMPIIVLSALLAEAESKPEIGEPYNVMLGKPFDVFKLVEKVKELLR